MIKVNVWWTQGTKRSFQINSEVRLRPNTRYKIQDRRLLLGWRTHLDCSTKEEAEVEIHELSMWKISAMSNSWAYQLFTNRLNMLRQFPFDESPTVTWQHQLLCVFAKMFLRVFNTSWLSIYNSRSHWIETTIRVVIVCFFFLFFFKHELLWTHSANQALLRFGRHWEMEILTVRGDVNLIWQLSHVDLKAVLHIVQSLGIGLIRHKGDSQAFGPKPTSTGNLMWAEKASVG